MSKTWYGYSKYVRSVDQARTVESTRDTDSSIFYLDWNGKERRMKKHTSWETWVDSAEELDRMIAARKEREEASRKDMLVRKAAPDLLKALEFVIERFGPCQKDYVFSKRLALDKARAAIAKAKGEQQ